MVYGSGFATFISSQTTKHTPRYDDPSEVWPMLSWRVHHMEGSSGWDDPQTPGVSPQNGEYDIQVDANPVVILQFTQLLWKITILYKASSLQRPFCRKVFVVGWIRIGGYMLHSMMSAWQEWIFSELFGEAWWNLLSRLGMDLDAVDMEIFQYKCVDMVRDASSWGS